MQNNVITVGDTVYERFQEYPDRSIYTTNSHTIGNPHILTLGRVVPATADASIKSRVKHSRTVTKADGTTAVIVIETTCSYPQFVTGLQVTEELTKHRAFLSDASTDALVLKQSI